MAKSRMQKRVDSWKAKNDTAKKIRNDSTLGKYDSIWIVSKAENSDVQFLSKKFR